jgi:hypothetical protein
MNNVLKKAGNNYYNIINKKEGKFNLIIGIVFICISLLRFILSCDWVISTIIFSFGIRFSFYYFQNKNYGNISGIYENGIIDYNNDLIIWKKIHSYKIIDKDIYGYINDGNIFEYKNIENIDEVKNIFEKNNISKREE